MFDLWISGEMGCKRILGSQSRISQTCEWNERCGRSSQTDKICRFMSLGPHQGYGNISRGVEYAVGWIADCIEFLNANNISFIEPTEEKVRDSTFQRARVLLMLRSNVNGQPTSSRSARAC